MMRKFLFLCLILLVAAPAFAIDLKDVEMSGMIRVRGYQMENFWDFNKDVNADRLEAYRTYATLQNKMKMSDDVAGVIKMSCQTWGSNGAGEQQLGENGSDKIFLDNAYIDVNNIWCQNLNLRMGRQNVQYGTGFVIFDGKSQYSSTSLYFDGVKATMKFTDRAALDAFYLNAQEAETASTGFIYNNPTNDDATVSGLYFTGKCPVMGTEKGQQELYAINRYDGFINKNIWMTGLRLSDKFAVGLDYSAEVAYQFGEFNDTTNVDQDAWGTKLEGGYTFTEAEFTPRLFAGYVFLGGDDPDTKDCERWDVMYGGWPQFGDMLAWKYLNVPANTSIAEYDSTWKSGSDLTGEAVYSNLSMPSIGISAKFPLNISAQLSYSMWMADETNPGVDDDLGDYYQLSGKYSYSPNLDFGAYLAMIEPGDAFANDDTAYETFIETVLKF